MGKSEWEANGKIIQLNGQLLKRESMFLCPFRDDGVVIPVGGY
jgi:hypothetical protein